MACLLVVACCDEKGSYPPTQPAVPEPSCADSGSLDADSAESSDARCDLRVDSVKPGVVTLDEQFLGPNVVLRGCAFTGTRDVQVNVWSVSFTVVDDTTIVFAMPLKRSDVPTLPGLFQIDVIKVQPDQTSAEIYLK